MYKNILFGSDLTSESLAVGSKALALAKAFSAQLSIIHVIEPPVSYRDHTPILSDVFNEMKLNAIETLSKFGQVLEISKENQYLDIGTPKFNIVDKAQAINADLIVVASHGVGGYKHSMGSTSSGIVTATHCDILVVSIHTLEPVKMKDDRIFLLSDMKVNSVDIRTVIDRVIKENK